MMSPSNLLSMEWNSWDRMGQQQPQGVSMDNTGATPTTGSAPGMGQPGVVPVPGGQNQYNMASAGNNPHINVQPPSEANIKSPGSDSGQLESSGIQTSASEHTNQNTGSIPDGEVRKRPSDPNDASKSKWPKT